MALCNVISVTLGAFLWIVLLLLHGHLLVWLRNDAIGPWLWFLPLSTVLVGLFQAYRNHANRGKAYGLIARANVVQSVGNALLKLVLGLLLAGAAGLIIGVVFGQLAGLLVFLIFHLPLLRRTGEPIRIAEMKRLAREYRLFPRYNLWQGLINNLSGAFPVFVLNGQFSTAQAGLYTFAYMVLYRPVNLVASAFYQVMFQRFVEKKHQEEDLLPGIRLFLKRSIQILALPFLLMALFAPEVFSFLFSDTWLEAGRYARILLPWLFMTALVMPLSFVPDLYKRQRGAMILDGIKMILRLGGLWAGVMRDDVFLSLALFSGASTVMLLISPFVVSSSGETPAQSHQRHEPARPTHPGRAVLVPARRGVFLQGAQRSPENRRLEGGCAGVADGGTADDPEGGRFRPGRVPGAGGGGVAGGPQILPQTSGNEPLHIRRWTGACLRLYEQYAMRFGRPDPSPRPQCHLGRGGGGPDPG
ncbi:MAG: lipopolysaccharide biosynthesis protein [Bacteroidales bacterium]